MTAENDAQYDYDTFGGVIMADIIESGNKARFPFLDFNDEAKWLSEKSGCSFEDALTFVQMEDDYCDGIGLNVYPDENGRIDAKKEGKKPPVVVEGEAVAEYASAHSNLPLELCQRLFDIESEYFKKIDLIYKEYFYEQN